MFDLVRRIARLAGAFSIGLGAVGCASAATTDIAPVPQLAEAPPSGAVPGPALWQVSDADTTIYLFGTIHFLPDDVEWFDQRIEAAFTSSSEFVTEIALDADQSITAQAVASTALLADGQTLRDLMSEQDREEYDEALVSLGMPVETLDMYEPWFAAVNLELIPLMQAGYDPSSGVEMVLNQRAAEKDKQALETIEQQLGFFDSLPMETQIAYLDGVVESIPTMSASMDSLLDAWTKGNEGAIGDLMSEGMQDPRLHEALLTARNARWAQWIEQRMTQPGDVFIAVGAGHLAGQGSVQQLLAERGVQVTRVWQ
ncbi:TraB/GumN family protein [Alteraurantiacibacter aestuarii]|uniref:TraB/GumN family protein n=1 Tax=Alteraurantiacibacter aestuarii TaxID=650004 RepID=UPI0031D6F3D3